MSTKRIRVLQKNTGANFSTIDSDENGKHQEFIKVNPEMAKTLLKNGKNRQLKPSRVEQYARDMSNGEWRMCDSQICIDVNGNVMNGQHRLHAIIKSETEQVFSFLFGCTKEDMEKIDCGASRSLYDVTSLNDIDVGQYGVSVSRFIRRQTIQRIPKRATRFEEADFTRRHKDVLKEVEDVIRGPNRKHPELAAYHTIGNEVGAAIFRAVNFYHDNPIKLGKVWEFANGLVNDEDFKLITSDISPKNRSFSLLVKVLNDARGEQGQIARDVRYRKTEAAIKNYVEGINIEVLRHSKKELFLMEEEIMYDGVSEENVESKELVISE